MSYLAYVRAEHLRRHVKSKHMGLKGKILVSAYYIHWFLTVCNRACLWSLRLPLQSLGQPATAYADDARCILGCPTRPIRIISVSKSRISHLQDREAVVYITVILPFTSSLVFHSLHVS